MREWFAPQARDDLLRFRSLAGDYEHADVLRVVLARAARSARLTTHFDLDLPKAAQVDPYWCHKHKRECRTVETAEHFLRRYRLDTLTRLKDFARVRTRRTVDVLHGDAAAIGLPGAFDAVVTSPPYPGLIDYRASSIAMRTSCWRSTIGVNVRSVQPPAGRPARRSGRTSTKS